MAVIDSIISSIEARWTDVAMSLIPRTAQERNLDGVYVAAFWLFYVDYTAFYPPYLCINTQALCEEDQSRGHDYRWSPPEWKIGLHDATDELASAYEPLMEALSDESDDVWNSAIEAHYQAMARVCRHLTSEIRASRDPRFSESFVAGIFEERESESEFERLVHLSIDDAILNQLPEPTWSNTQTKR